MLSWLFAWNLLVGQQTPESALLFNGPLGPKGGATLGHYRIELNLSSPLRLTSKELRTASESPIQLLRSSGIPDPYQSVEISDFEIEWSNDGGLASLKVFFKAPDGKSTILLELVWIQPTRTPISMAKAHILGAKGYPRDLVRIPYSIHLTKLNEYVAQQRATNSSCSQGLTSAFDPRERPGSLNFLNLGE